MAIYIPDHPLRILIIGGSGSGKTNVMFNLIKEQGDIDRIYLYAIDLGEPKYEFLIKKCKDAGIKYLNDLNTFIECSDTLDDVYENIGHYNPNKKRKILIVFDDMIADSVPKDVRLTLTHYLIMKIENKKELQNIATNHSADIDYKDFVKSYRECTKEPYSFLTIDTTLPARDLLRFCDLKRSQKNLRFVIFVDIGKPDGLCSLIFVLNEFSGLFLYVSVLCIKHSRSA